MTLQDIYQYFASPPPVYLGQEATACYILSVLIDKGDSYGAALIRHIKSEHPTYRISKTILYHALTFLMNEEIVLPYWAHQADMGRSRRMYQVALVKLDSAKQLAQLWYQYLEKRSDSSTFELT